VTFGDNTNGMVPAVGLQIWATYRVGVGSAGNLLAGAVTTFVTPITGVSIQLLSDGVTSTATAMTGGSDPETIEQIRANAPTVFQAQYRAVSPQDFIALALSVPGVLMANAIAQRSSAVSLYIMGPNYTGPGPALIQSILSYFNGKTAAGCTISIVPPYLVPIDVGTVGSPVQLVVQNSYLQASVLANVTAAIQALFTPPNVSFGQLLNVSQIYGAILAVPGVSYVVIPVFTREDAVQAGIAPIQLNPGEVATSGVQNISVTGGIL
jgi:predicted phage baseplate assembly protein